MRLWQNRNKSQRSKTPAPPTPSPAPAATQDLEKTWQLFMALGPTKDDLLQCFEDHWHGPEVLQHAGEVLLDQYSESLTLEELNIIVCYTGSTPVGLRAGLMIIKRAKDKNDLGQVLLSVPSLRVRVAHLTLSMEPESHDLFRCLEIPEVAEEALEMLLKSNPRRRSLLHLLRYGPNNKKYHPNVVKTVEEYVQKNNIRVSHTRQMCGLLDMMRTIPQTKH